MPKRLPRPLGQLGQLWQPRLNEAPGINLSLQIPRIIKTLLQQPALDPSVEKAVLPTEIDAFSFY
jgi:hypothetical protein